MRRLLPLLAVSLLAACAGAPKKPSTAGGALQGPGATADAGVAPDCTGFKPYAPAQEDPSTRGDYVAGGLYKPGVRDSTPDYIPRVDCIAEPVVVHLPRSSIGNRSPYQVLGKSYRVLDSTDGFVETGLASYYGNKFHGRRTSNQEVYDMYAFSAAHKSLPLPSFARVTNLENGRSVVVRVNDRGPFHEGRVIDLSYAAAVKLDIHRRGTGKVEVRALKPGDTGTMLASASSSRPASRPAGTSSAVAAATGMDTLVGTLPKVEPMMLQPRAVPVAAAAQASGAAQQPAPTVLAPSTQPMAPVQVSSQPAYAHAADHPGYGKEEDRFRLVDENGRIRTADEFDAWLRARQARVAAEQAAWAANQAQQAGAAAGATVTAAPSTPVTPAPAQTPVAVASPPASTPVQGAPSAAAGQVTLQVGVFSVRDNAERALATLRSAGVDTAWMQELVSGGKTLWRVRVGPVAQSVVGELSGRVSGLGFGVPQVVR